MKNVLVITTDYYPYPSSNTNCFEPLLEKMEQSGFNVDIVTRRLNKRDLPYEKMSKNIHVFRVDDIRTINTFRVNEWANGAKHKSVKLIRKLIALISKTIYYAIFCLFREEKRFAGWDTKQAIKKSINMNAERSYDIIISISHPVITHKIASRLLKAFNNRPKWIWMEYDPYCYNQFMYGKACLRRLLPIQLKYFEECDTVVTTPELLPLYFEQQELKGVAHKIHSLAYANMKEVKINQTNAAHIELKKNKVNCIFAGALGESIRDPKYLIGLFSTLADDLHLIIMTGSRPGFFEKELAAAEDAVTLSLNQTRDTAYLAMANSDILVNIGNLVAFQTPGKIFEYMAMGKPIIHISSIENDSSIKYFKDYPYVLIIKQYEKNIDAHRTEILDFCRTNAGKTMSFDEVKQAVPNLVSENVTYSFLELIRNTIDKR